MHTTCPKCKNENWNETINIENNPNLIACEDCDHVYFVELKLVYKKAYNREDGGFSLIIKK